MKITKNASKAVSTINTTAIPTRKPVQDKYLPWGIHSAVYIGWTMKDGKGDSAYTMLHFKVGEKTYEIFEGHTKFPNAEASNNIQPGDKVLLATCWGKRADGKPCMFYAVHSA